MLIKRKRLFALLCAGALILSLIPLYAISFYNHPYYDDYAFSADTRAVWRATGSLPKTAAQALISTREIYMTWQGTYTGTLLSCLQPGMFSESLYFLTTFILLTAFLLCFWYLIKTALTLLCGADIWDAVIVASGMIFLMVQLAPDPDEAFFWFNGGIGNAFIYSLIALAAGLFIRLMKGERRLVKTAALAVITALIGGGSYGGGLLSIFMYAGACCWAFAAKSPRRGTFAGLLILLLACFAASVAAPGNAVRAELIGASVSPVKAVLQALYYGLALAAGWITLPLIAVTMLVLPIFYRLSGKARASAGKAWPVLGVGFLAYCSQLAPTMYAGVFIGGGRAVDTYYISFVTLWFAAAYCATGAVRRALPKTPRAPGYRALIITLALLALGCLGFKRPADQTLGAQNLSGVSAALSIVTGEAARYDAEMTAREALLNDDSRPVITLSPLTGVPDIFMKDLLRPDANYDARPALMEYYGKQAILFPGEEGS